MPFVHASVLGGLPVVAEVWYSGPDYYGEYDAGVDGLYWLKRDGTKGAPLSERMMAKIESKDAYWQSDVLERANDFLAYNCPTRRRNPEWRGLTTPDCPEWIEEGEYSEEYLLLNPRK
jgi:hypothetical protein